MLRILMLLAVIGAAVLAAPIDSIIIHGLAVSSTGEGSVVDISISAIKYGNGSVYVAAVPETGEGFGPSAQVAAFVASRVANVDLDNITFLVSVRGLETAVGGPSASGYMAVAMYSILTGVPMRNDTVMTGIILPDGLIGPVGGVGAKAEAAERAGFKRLLVPYGQQGEVTGNIKVIPVLTIEDAIRELTGTELRVRRVPEGEIDKGPYREVGRLLFELVYARFNSTVPPQLRQRYLPPNIGDLVRGGRYYTAASLIFSSLNRYIAENIDSVPNPLGTARSIADEVAGMLDSMNATTANLDIMVAIYRRIYEVRIILDSRERTRDDVAAAYARAITLPDWVTAIKSLRGGSPIPPQYLEDLALVYFEYARSVYSYLYSLVGAASGPLNRMETLVRYAMEAFNEGRYAATIALSLEVIADASARMNLITVGRIGEELWERILGVVRPRALDNMWYVSRGGGSNILPLLYLEYGDYYRETGDYFTSLYFYELSSIYGSMVRDMLRRIGAPINNITVSVDVPPQASVDVDVPGDGNAVDAIAGLAQIIEPYYTYVSLAILLLAGVVVILRLLMH